MFDYKIGVLSVGERVPPIPSRAQHLVVIQHKDPDPRRIDELENEIARALTQLSELDRAGRLPAELIPLLRLAPPPGLEPRVSLRHGETDRRIKGTASVASWRADSCGAWIEYVAGTGAGGTRAEEDESLLLDDLVRALLELDRQPRRFTSWNWLRDQYLPEVGWTLGREHIQRLIQRAVEVGIATTRKIPNPRTPDFPVTSVELNREHPLVRRRLGATGLSSRFQPVTLPGVPVSTTIIEERR